MELNDRGSGFPIQPAAIGAAVRVGLRASAC